MLSTPCSCCSMGVATDCSRVSASAPTYVALSRISGGASSGNCAIGSRNMATRPMITVMIEMTIATIGRLIKNLDMAFTSARTLLRRGFGFGHRFERLRIDRHARLHPLGPLGDNLLARLQPLLNDPICAHSLTDFNRSDANLVIVADYGHLVTALQLCDRALGNKQGAFLCR